VAEENDYMGKTPVGQQDQYNENNFRCQGYCWNYMEMMGDRWR